MSIKDFLFQTRIAVAQISDRRSLESNSSPEFLRKSRLRKLQKNCSRAPKCKYRKSHRSAVTCWIVFHIRIIYIGEGCTNLFSASYQTPAATTFLSRKLFRNIPGLSHRQKPTACTSNPTLSFSHTRRSHTRHRHNLTELPERSFRMELKGICGEIEGFELS